MSDKTVDADMFAIALNGIVEDSLKNVKVNTAKAVTQSSRKGAKIAKQKAKAAGGGKWGAEYTEAFSSHVVNHGDYTTGEIGNKGRQAGLVHLLEKGHNTLTGRRTRAFPHMMPTKEEVDKDLAERVAKAVDEGLRA